MNAQDRADSQSSRDTQAAVAVGSTRPATDRSTSVTHEQSVGGGDSPQTTNAEPTPKRRTSSADLLATSQRDCDTHCGSAGGGSSQPPVHHDADAQEDRDGWLELRIWSEQLEDAMHARIAAVNRAERGGVDPVVYVTYIEALTAAEHVCELAMKRCYRRVVPAEIVAWQKSERGIGEKLTARMLGHLGDPCIATPHHWEGTGTNRVLVADAQYMRTVSQLWQYCGVGDPARRKHKGMTADETFALGNPALKMLLHLHAEACVKAASGCYREVYDKARWTYQDRTHAADCVRCGPSGKPAAEGTPWSKGHQHAAALRKVAKEILRDLWRVRHAALCPPTMSAPTPTGPASAGTLDRPPTNSGATPNVPPLVDGEPESRVA